MAELLAILSQALRGEPITLYGDGSQSRSFVMSTI